MSNLARQVKLDVVAEARAAGSSEYQSSAVDMQGFEGVAFIVPISTHDGGTTQPALASVTLQEGPASTGPFNALSGSSASFTYTTDADSRVLVSDVYRPKDRYVRASVVRATTDQASIGPIVAAQYGAAKQAVSHGSDISIAYTQSPST